MAEKDMRGRIIKALRPFDAIAVENPIRPGTPDVNYVEGWIELKWAREWPLQGGPLRLPHFTKQQKTWLLRRCKYNGNAWLLLQVRQEWLLFRGEVAARMLGEATREELILAASAYWENGLDEKELRRCLKRNEISDFG